MHLEWTTQASSVLDHFYMCILMYIYKDCVKWVYTFIRLINCALIYKHTSVAHGMGSVHSHRYPSFLMPSISSTYTQYSVLSNRCMFLRPSKSSPWGGWSSCTRCTSLFVLEEVKERLVNRMQAVTALWAFWLPMYSFQVASVANSLFPDARAHTHTTNSLYNEARE